MLSVTTNKIAWPPQDALDMTLKRHRTTHAGVPIPFDHGAAVPDSTGRLYEQGRRPVASSLHAYAL
jgi:hypothetical protein